MKSLLLLLLALLWVGISWAEAPPRIGYHGWGPRVGVASDPDLAYVGAQVDFGDFADRVRFQPNFEIGSGDDETVASFDFEAAYRLLPGWREWSPYVGGGVGLNFDEAGRGPDRIHDDEMGASFLTGMEKGMPDGDRVFFDLKLGLVDAPALKIGFGYTFNR